MSGKPDSLSGWDEKLNLANQSDIQSACWSECERLLVEWQESERQRIATEMEHVITYYCKVRILWLLYWRDASHNTLDYCIGGMHLTIH